MIRSGSQGEYVDHLRSEYWGEPGTQKGVTQFLGAAGLDWSTMQDIDHEFLAVSNREKMGRGDKQSPAVIVEPEGFADTLDQYNGQVELHASLWQKKSDEQPDLPRKGILYWDVDVFDKHDPQGKFNNPAETFETMEPVYKLMKAGLEKYGINYLTVASGAGYNFYTQIPTASNADLMRKVLDTVEVEPTVLGKQAYPNPNLKRRKPVPESAERLHLASTRLQQFLINQVIRQARDESEWPVDITDKGARGIAFDNTSMVYRVEERTFGVPGSPYFIKPESKNTDFDGTMIRMPRQGNGFDVELGEILDKRSHFMEASNFLNQVDCSIPDGSQGITGLLDDYLDSDLRRLHQAMDENFGDNPDEFDKTYRQYDAISAKTTEPEIIRRMIDNAPKDLLVPDSIDHFVWEIFNSWGGDAEHLDVAPHVAGLLRAVYEDPNLHWGDKWTKQTDALRYARGWVSLVLGQAYEESADK